jgi:trigger factor
MTVKNLEKKEGSVTFVMEIEKDLFEAAIDKAYRKTKNSINVPGFRKGKAPRKIIEGMFGATVFYEDAINDMFPGLYNEAVANESLKVVGQPSITNVDYSNGPLELTVSADLYPEVTLGEYKGLEAVKTAVEVTDADVDAELARVQQRNARISTVDRPVQEGDTVVIDFEGSIDGVPFDGGKAEGQNLRIGSGMFIPGFEEGCVGMTVGEEKDITTTFPEDYGAPELAGKVAVFKVKVHEIKESILPELDDEFAKDVSEFDTLEEYKADLRAKELETRTNESEANFKNAVLSKAMDNMTVQIPNSMVEEELDAQVQNYLYQIQMSGIDPQQYFQMMGTDANGFRANLRPMAYEQLKSRLLLEKIAEVEGFEVTDEELEAEYSSMAEQYQMEVEKVKEYIVADDLRRDLLLRKASELIASTAIPVAEEKQAEAPAEEPKKKPAAKKTTKKKAEETAEGEETPKKKPAAKKTTKKKAEEATEAEPAAEE